MENFKKKLTSAILCTAFLTMQATLAAIDTGLGAGNGGAVIDSVSGGFVGVTTGSNSASLEFNGNAHVDWDSLNVNQGESLNFNATNGVSGLTILNTVKNGMSNIHGSINSNAGIAKLIISNPNGMLFDGASFTTVGDVMLTTQAMGANFVGNDMTLTYGNGENPNAIVTIKNNSNFNIGGEFNITSPSIQVIKSAITAGNGVKFITADGQNYLVSPTTSNDTQHKAVRLESASINGDVYIASGKDLINIVNGGKIDGDLTIRSDGNVALNYTNNGNTFHVTGNVDSVSDGRIAYLRQGQVDGNLKMSNSGGFLEVADSKINGDMDLKTTVASNAGVKHFIHVVGDTEVGGNATIDSAHNIHIGGYNSALNRLQQGSLKVGGDLKAIAHDGSIAMTVDTEARTADLKAGLNILSDGKAVLKANEYKFEAKHFVGGLTDEQAIIGVMENYIPIDRTTVKTYRLSGESQDRTIDNRTLEHTYFQISGGEVKAATASQPATGHVHLRSAGNMKVTGLNATKADLSSKKDIVITGPNVHADHIYVNGETDKLTVDLPTNSRDYTLTYRNIKDNTDITIDKTTEITYDMANGIPNGWNNGTQTSENTYLVVPGTNPPGPGPGPQPLPDPEDNDNVKILNNLNKDPINSAIDAGDVYTPVAFAADLDEEIDSGVRKNVDGSVTVVKAFTRTK